MNRHASMILALPTTLLLLNAATAQEIIKRQANSQPRRMGAARLCVWAGLFDIRRNQGRGNRQWDAGGRPPSRRRSPSPSSSTVSLTLSTAAQAFGETRK